MAKSFGILVLIVGIVLSACTKTQPARNSAEQLVDKARWTVEMFKSRGEKPDHEFVRLMKDAHGIVVFPGAYKGAFLIGAEGGNGVLLARDNVGDWGYPAFYTMGAGSFGLQIGAEESEMVLVLRTPEAVEAVVNNQGKLGGDMQMTMGNVGAGVSGATTTNMGADIVGFAHGAGLYAGVSLEGAVLARRNDLNQAYYGEPDANAKTIALEHRFANPQADPLRQSLVFN